MEEPATFTQVVFIDIPHTYPPSSSITCHYTVPATFQPTTRDWVGIFKVGWSTTKDYHTFVWVEPSCDVAEPEPVGKKVLFSEYYLSMDDSEFYQFCYIDAGGQVRGASTPFCFKSPDGASVDCSLENDLLVITTQEQVEQSAQEKVDLMKEVDRLGEEAETLRRALKEREAAVRRLKVENGEREQGETELAEELNQRKEENQRLTQNLEERQQEAQRLQEEIGIQMEKHLELERQNADQQEKLRCATDIQELYDQAEVRIHQLTEKQKHLMAQIDVQSVEIAELKPKVGERDQELLKLKDSVRLLQVDLQSSEKDNGRLSAELCRLLGLTLDSDELRRENQDLRSRLARQENARNIPEDDDDDNDDDPKVRWNALLHQLEDARSQLASERKASGGSQRRAEQAETELADARDRSERAAAASAEAQRRSQKLEAELMEARGTIADREEVIKHINGIIEEKENAVMDERREKDELTRENQALRRDLEQLCREFTELRAAPPSSPVPAQPCGPAASAAHGQWHNTPPEAFQDDSAFEGQGSITNTEERSLVCGHCHEHFPGITQEELVQHEQSHRVCPFCTLICDSMEQSVFEDHVYSHEL